MPSTKKSKCWSMPKQSQWLKHLTEELHCGTIKDFQIRINHLRAKIKLWLSQANHFWWFGSYKSTGDGLFENSMCREIVGGWHGLKRKQKKTMNWRPLNHPSRIMKSPLQKLLLSPNRILRQHLPAVIILINLCPRISPNRLQFLILNLWPPLRVLQKHLLHSRMNQNRPFSQSLHHKSLILICPLWAMLCSLLQNRTWINALVQYLLTSPKRVNW